MHSQFKGLLIKAGLIKVPKFTVTYGGSNGSETFSLVTFSDGAHGHVINKSDGSYSPQCKLIKSDEGKTFVTINDAAEALYKGLTVNGK